jgi:proline iminopeptidase
VDDHGTEREGMIAVDAGGHRVFYRMLGDAEETLLVLHGGPGISHRYLSRLSELGGTQLRIVFYDQLGSGDSDWPEESDEDLWTIDRFVHEAETVRRELDLGSVHLLGQSWGGGLALQYALDYPSNVKSLVISNAGASVAETVRGMAQLKVELADVVGAQAFARAMRLEALGKVDNPEYQEWALNVYSRHLRRATPFDPARSRREYQEIVEPIMAELGPAYLKMWGPNEFTCTGGGIELDVSNRLNEISAPTLILCGWYDEVIVDVCRGLAAGIQDNEFLIFGNSSHFIILEKEAELYLGAIANFLSRHIGTVITPTSLKSPDSEVEGGPR